MGITAATTVHSQVLPVTKVTEDEHPDEDYNLSYSKHCERNPGVGGLNPHSGFSFLSFFCMSV